MRSDKVFGTSTAQCPVFKSIRGRSVECNGKCPAGEPENFCHFHVMLFTQRNSNRWEISDFPFL